MDSTPIRRTSSKPGVHHYIPRFLLRAWTGSDGRLERYTKPPGQDIHARRVHPARVGFEKHLYDFASYDERVFAGLEKAYFAPVDNAAAQSRLQILKDVKGPWTTEARSAWTRFLMSLLHRTPPSIELFRDGTRKVLGTPVDEIQRRWDCIRNPDDCEKYLDQFVRDDPEYFERTALKILPGIIDSENLGTFINRMAWGTCKLHVPGRSLLLSDYPLVLSDGIRNENGHIALAIDPHTLFIASYQERFFEKLNKQGPKETLRAYNAAVVSRATHFVVAKDLKQTRFIENHFGRKPFNYLRPVMDQVVKAGLD